jgi:hypothetical protein
MVIRIDKLFTLLLGVWFLASCSDARPVVFNEGSYVPADGSEVAQQPLPPATRGSQVSSGVVLNDPIGGTGGTGGAGGSRSAAGAQPPVSVVDAMPGTFIPEAGEPGFDLFSVENPIELALDNAATRTVPRTQVSQPVLTGEGYGASQSATGLSFIPDTAKREVVVRSYNHTPGTAGLNVGDAFTFSNPTTTYNVRSITVDSIFWDADNGEQSVTTHNLLLPAASWSSDGRGQGSREISQVQGGLFPLAVGNTMSFKAVTNANISPYRWESFWSCSVINRGFVKVVSGEFDVFIINCSRSSLDEVTFYFAPKLGHYVRQEVKSPGNPEVYVRELIAYDRPNLSYAAGVPSRVDNTLMTGLSPGSQAQFRSTYLPTKGSVDTKVEEAMKTQEALANATAKSFRPQPTTPSRTNMKADDMMKDTMANASSSSLSDKGPSGIYVHLASYKSPKNLDLGWKALLKKIPSLSSFSSTSRFVNVPSRGGDFFRLFVGPFASVNEARGFCTGIKSEGQYCQVMRVQ